MRAINACVLSFERLLTRRLCRRFYAKAVNCCAQVVDLLNSGPDGGSCPSAGDCRGFAGTCADLVQQFNTLAVLPTYPNGLQDYTCTAFPDDNKPLDSFIVGLISIAIAIPVTMFINACFIIANDADAPESWMEWVGWRKLVFGANAHRRWYYSGPQGQPNRHVKWFIRSAASEAPEIIGNLWHALVCALTGRELPWHVKAREAMEHAAEGEAPEGAAPEAKDEATESKAPEATAEGEDGASTTSSKREARALARFKHIYTATGLASVYIVWGVFIWFIFVCACACASAFELALTLTATQTGCSSTSCWATMLNSSLLVPGASASACA